MLLILFDRDRHSGRSWIRVLGRQSCRSAQRDSHARPNPAETSLDRHSGLPLQFCGESSRSTIHAPAYANLRLR